MDRRIFRVIDANFNRAREGLRVCEEVARFVLNSPAMTRRIKTVRHGVSACLGSLPITKRRLLESRDVHGDVGRPPSPLEKKRLDACDVFSANIQRAKESLRVLEEFLKLIDGRLADKMKSLRFETYAIEKAFHKRLETIRDT